MPLTVLVTADVHLGRSSSQAPAAVPADRLRTRHAWDRLVATALERQVAALVVAGDLIDAANRRWEAMGPVVRDVQRLRQAGVHTIAVAGNHDWETLRRLGNTIERTDAAFTLLGANGRWQRAELRRDGERLAIHGWSFPSERVLADPVRSHELPAETGVPALGVVHGDLDVPTSPYAPLQRSSLEGRPLDGWILGHVHRPRLTRLARGFALYPGSPQAMDFGEPGAHGAWLVKVVRGGLAEPEFVPLSSLRYEWLDMDLGAAASAEQAERLALDALCDLERRCATESGEPLEGLSIRVRLVGRCAIDTDDLRRQLEQWQGASRLAVRVAEVIDCSMPPIDLQGLASGAATSPLAMTARLLLAIEGGAPDTEAKELLREVQRRLHDVDGQAEYANLAPAGQEDDRGHGDDRSQDDAARDGDADVEPDVDRSESRRAGPDHSRQALAWALRRVLTSLLQQEVA